MHVYISGFAAGSVIAKFGTRKCGICAGVVAALSVGVSYFATSLTYLIVSVGLLAGKLTYLIVSVRHCAGKVTYFIILVGLLAGMITYLIVSVRLCTDLFYCIGRSIGW